MKTKKIKWFTLVELIVVVTILAILWTIWFASYSSYLRDTRDSSRISQLKSLEESLDVYSVKKRKLPIPDSPRTEITNSWTKIATQWYLWEKILDIIDYSAEWVDPLDKTYFPFYVTQNKKYFQLMAFLEEEENLQIEWTGEEEANINLLYNKANASDYLERYPTVHWDKLWMFLTFDHEPIQESNSNIDVTDVWSLQLKSYMADSEYVRWTWVDFAFINSIVKVWWKWRWAFVWEWSEIDRFTCNDYWNYKCPIKTTKDCENAWDILYATLAWLENYLVCDDDIIVCSWRNTWILISACNAWARYPWFWSDSYGWLYQWWNKANIKGMPFWSQVALQWKYSTHYHPYFIEWKRNLSTSPLTDAWWWTTWTQKQQRWPCEEWYHIPSMEEFASLKSFASIWWYDSNKIKNVLKIPFAWHMRNTDWRYFWWNWQYWTNNATAINPDTNYYGGYRFLLAEDELDNENWYINASDWMSIRCFKNTD